MSISIVGPTSRSLGSFASPDREFTEDEIAQLSACLAEMHEVTAAVEPEFEPDDLKIKRFASSLAHGERRSRVDARGFDVPAGLFRLLREEVDVATVRRDTPLT